MKIPVPYFFLVESPDFFHFLLLKSLNSGEDPGGVLLIKLPHFLDNAAAQCGWQGRERPTVS